MSKNLCHLKTPSPLGACPPWERRQFGSGGFGQSRRTKNALPQMTRPIDSGPTACWRQTDETRIPQRTQAAGRRAIANRGVVTLLIREFPYAMKDTDGQGRYALLSTEEAMEMVASTNINPSHRPHVAVLGSEKLPQRPCDSWPRLGICDRGL